MALESDGGLLYPFVVLGGGRQGDLQKALKTTVSKQSLLVADIDANGNIANRVNIYSKHKPFRSGIIFFDHYSDENSYREAMLRTADYGISVNTSVDRSKNYQNPYWTYARPRGSEYNEELRVWDFELYNPLAESPMLPTTIDLASNQQFLVDLRTIVNTSQNVEFQLDDMYDFPTFDWVGFILWDATKKFGYLLVTNIQLEELYQGFSSGHNPSFYTDISSLPFSDGDEVEFFWCTHTTTGVPNQDDEFDYELITSSNSPTISLMATDSTHGHAILHIIKFNIHEDIGFIDNNTVISAGWNANQTSFSFNGFSTRLQCLYTWRQDEQCRVFFRMVIGEEGTTETLYKTVTLNSINAEQYYELALANGTKSFDINTIRDYWDYIIPMYLYIRLDGSPDEKLLVKILYNVQTQTYTYTL